MSIPEPQTSAPPEFEYCTLQMLRDEGMCIAELPDKRAKMLIRLASRRINEVTSQWFSPVRRFFRVRGRHNPFAHLENLIPIVKIEQLAIGYPGQDIVVPDFSYIHTPGRRIIELNRRIKNYTTPLAQRVTAGMYGIRDPIFPQGPEVVKITGVFGWLENYDEAESKVVGLVEAGDTDVIVDNLTGWEVGSVAVFDGVRNKIAMVSGIDSALMTLKFDPLDFDVPDNSMIHCYGRVPMAIQRACQLVVHDKVKNMSDFIREEEGVERRILNESTEGYSYSIQPITPQREKHLGGPLGGINSTGNLEADMLLSAYVAPVYVGYA